MAEDSVGYALCRISREQLEKLRDDGKHGGREAVAGYPYYYCAESGEIEVYPDMIGGRLDIRGDQVLYVPEPAKRPISEFREYFNKMWDGVQAAQRKEHPAQMPEPGTPIPDFDFSDDFPCGICGQRGLHACEPPAPTILNRIVSMVEFKGRLYVATETGVFVKRDNEDIFEPVEMIPAITGMGSLGRAADEAAGLVPLHPRQTAERADPFVPNRFGEHG